MRKRTPGPAQEFSDPLKEERGIPLTSPEPMYLPSEANCRDARSRLSSTPSSSDFPSSSTLRRQAAAINSNLWVGSKRFSHPRRFLRGISLISLPAVHHFPTWKLNKVLSALMGPPFEPMAKIALKKLTVKTLLLVAITSARQVSELGALLVSPNLCIFHKDRVVLRPDPTFIPKVNTWFHRELSMQSFCPNPRHPKERAWHNLDVRRASTPRKPGSLGRRRPCLFGPWGGIWVVRCPRLPCPSGLR